MGDYARKLACKTCAYEMGGTLIWGSGVMNRGVLTLCSKSAYSTPNVWVGLQGEWRSWGGGGR